MLDFRYHSPVDIHFGYDVRSRLKSLAADLGRRAFLVADPSVARTVLFKGFLDECPGFFVGTSYDIQPNPTTQSVGRIAAQMRTCEADLVVGLGGGSSLDTAKAASLVAATGIRTEDYHAGKAAVGTTSLPVVAMPTTAGTGSEVTAVSVLTDADRGVKAPMSGPALMPRIALVDPEWTISAPPHVTAATGMDALSHALEAHWSIHAQPICDALAEKAAGLLLVFLDRAYTDGHDREARENVCLGSLLAGLAFAVPKTAAVHACSFPLTQRFGLPHGVACAFTLDLFLEYNAEVLADKLRHLACSLGFDTVPALAARIRELKRSMNLPATLEQAGIGHKQLEQLVSESFHPNMNNNPRKVTQESLLKLYLSLAEAPARG